jgi:type I restriction enzyme, S subunit
MTLSLVERVETAVNSVALGDLYAKRHSVNPAKFSDEVFELFSVPAYERDAPDKVLGSDIGSSKVSVEQGDTLLCRIVPHIRRAWVVPEGDGSRQIASGEWIVLRNSEVDPSYLRHVLLGDSFHKRFMSTVAGVGGSLMRARPAQAADIRIPVPPLSEQRRIATILDQAYHLRAQRGRALALLREAADALFVDMIGGAEPNTWKWETGRVDEFGRVQLGRQRAPKYQTGEWTKPYMRVANVMEDRLSLGDVLQMDFDPRDSDTYVLRYGDILLNEGQSTELVGRPAMWRNEIDDCCFQNTLVRFVPNTEQCLPEFALGLFLHYYRSGMFSRVSSKTSNVAHLGSSRFAAMAFPKVPLGIQAEFAERSRMLDALRSAHGDQLTRLDLLFASLQHRAFRGEL